VRRPVAVPLAPGVVCAVCVGCAHPVRHPPPQPDAYLETFFPPPRSLRVASSAHATGPYGPASPSFTDEDTEGPSLLNAGNYWYVYFDYYTRGRYGAVRTHDFTHWEPFSDSLKTPRGIRHGSAFRASASVLRGLLALDSLPR